MQRGTELIPLKLWLANSKIASDFMRVIYLGKDDFNSLNCINITVLFLLSTPNFLYQVPKISIPYCQNVQECRGRFRNVVKCSHTMFNKQHNKGICHNVSPSVPGRLLPARWHAHSLFSSSLLILSNYMWHSLSITPWKRPSFWQGNGEYWLGNISQAMFPS